MVCERMLLKITRSFYFLQLLLVMVAMVKQFKGCINTVVLINMLSFLGKNKKIKTTPSESHKIDNRPEVKSLRHCLIICLTNSIFYFTSVFVLYHRLWNHM